MLPRKRPAERGMLEAGPVGCWVASPRAAPLLASRYLRSVPHRPDWSQHAGDPRFDGYRDRVARVQSDGQDVGHLLVRVETYATVEGGYLWWRRWAVRDALWLVMRVHGRLEDHLLHADRLEGELRDWGRGLFRYRGAVLHLHWTSPEESARLRRSEFGIE